MQTDRKDAAVWHMMPGIGMRSGSLVPEGARRRLIIAMKKALTTSSAARACMN
jgi:hypothetical protein